MILHKKKGQLCPYIRTHFFIEYWILGIIWISTRYPHPKYSIFLVYTQYPYELGFLGMGIGYIPTSYPIPNKKVGTDVWLWPYFCVWWSFLTRKFLISSLWKESFFSLLENDYNNSTKTNLLFKLFRKSFIKLNWAEILTKD